MERRLRLAVVVLAAGAGTRFGAEPGAKLLADVDGQPMLASVLEEVRAYGPAATVVVLGRAAARIELALTWSDEIRVRNHAPELGLASSLQVGIDTLRALPDELDGAFVVLGDQPQISVQTMRTLEAAAGPAARPVVVPRYDTPGPRNPVLLLRPAWGWVDEIRGDHGLGSLIEQRPDSVLEVRVAGEMPDIDTPDDLDALRSD